MIIQNVTSGKTPLENSFVALDRQANSLGRCDVEPLMNEHLMPGRPYELKLSVQGRPEARLQLYAAGIARAMARAIPAAYSWSRASGRPCTLNLSS